MGAWSLQGLVLGGVARGREEVVREGHAGVAETPSRERERYT